MRDTITVPAWADEIALTRKRSGLLVCGTGRVPDLAAFVTDRNGLSKSALARYVPAITVGDKRRGRPPHIEFALATRRAAQIKFVAKFGPVWGVVRQVEPTILVEQDITALETEQATFQTATELVGHLQAANRDIRRIVLSFLELAVQNRIGLPEEPGHRAMFQSFIERTGTQGSRVLSEPKWESEEGLLPWDHSLDPFYEQYAHWTLCRLFNRFPPTLIFFDGRPAELPPHRPEGILPVLYFMLRSDYLATDKRIGSCANVECRKLFAIERAEQRFCSARCSALQRGRDYWRRTGKKRRRERRKAEQG
jgi:hypothetical protein